MNSLSQLNARLEQLATVPQEKRSAFFKTGTGHYAEHDIFLGVTVPALRTLAKDFYTLSLHDIQNLINSPINEKRFLALIILVHRYQKATNDQEKDEIYNFYMRNLKHVNNWNLVDASAHLIAGAHTWPRSKDILVTLAQSKNIWERRIAIVATWYYIRKNAPLWTITIAEILLNDTHDLIHKAVGWMLREAGKRDQLVLTNFLDKYAVEMPRTMLRYALEKLPAKQKESYMKQKKPTSNNINY